MLAPSLGEAWHSWFPQVVSLIVHDATLPPELGKFDGGRCPGCVAGGRCPRCVAGRSHSYFAISISDFERGFSLADEAMSTSYYVLVHISGKVFELVPIPGYFVDGHTRYPGKF